LFSERGIGGLRQASETKHFPIIARHSPGWVYLAIANSATNTPVGNPNRLVNALSADAEVLTNSCQTHPLGAKGSNSLSANRIGDDLSRHEMASEVKDHLHSLGDARQAAGVPRVRAQGTGSLGNGQRMSKEIPPVAPVRHNWRALSASRREVSDPRE
jgi:hypothetical protein